MNFEDYETLPTNNVGTHMIAGAIAGIMEHCVMYPLDSVKTRMQSLVTSGREGISETLLRMIRHEGMLRPVRGMSAMVVGAGPSHALYFSSYEYLKNTLVKYSSSEKYHTAVYGASGCIATLLHDGIMNPAEVVKQRMQMINSPYKSVLQCVSHVYNTEGPRAFYRSYTTQLTMNVPFQSIHFMVYEFAQKITNKEGTYNPTAHMLSGALAGAVASAITTPLDVCKTLLNTQQTGNPTGLVQAVKTVYRLGGPGAYFRGMQARVMYQMPATAICWSTYEFFKYLLGNAPEVRQVIAPIIEEKPIKLEAPAMAEKINLKPSLPPRELPAMSGAGLYGSISFNTMHNADTTFNRRQKDTILDIVHT
ncbi:mitoferrin-1 [Aethina tumida]|uniref:mitoferrin-1 n=1 Tax=Aethina tumida TaxID=116153 RepID=UPI00096B2E81|nr:mitoferrin-1 [Aethina tumida]XP_019871726.1 mitoferrin-1 [Aethina tumida]